MIRVNQVKLPVSHSEADLRKKTAKMMGVSADQIQSVELVRQSLDARKKPDLYYLYALDVAVAGKEAAIVKRARSVNVQIRKEEAYRLPDPGIEPLRERPVIVGFGPAGMFCGLMLARAGYRPLILERGLDADSRAKAVARYWTDGTLDPECNVQFGEGGAGTFSDGKLNTLVKDPSGRNKEVLKILAQAGADPTITYVNKPHVGTDVLRTVVKNIRSEIESLGGEVRFGCRLEDFETQNGHLCSIRVSARKGTSEAGRTVEEIPASALVLAIGHSARDTFAMLAEKPLDMQAKAFAVGLRIQHPQTQINLSQYGREEAGNLGAASYKLTAQTSGGRGVDSSGRLCCGCILRAGTAGNQRHEQPRSCRCKRKQRPDCDRYTGGFSTAGHTWRRNVPASAGGSGIPLRRRKNPGTALWRFPGKPEFNGIWSSDTTV